MQELLTFITEVNNSGNNADSLIKIFSNRLRSLYGPCSIALLSQSGLPTNQCQVTVLVDEYNTTIIADDHRNSASESQPVYTHKNLHTVLNPSQPTVLGNDDPRISELFGDLFEPYATILSLPLFMPEGVYKWMFLLFINPTRLKPVDIERLLLIATLATNLGTAVENAKQLQQANKWIANEIKSVAKIQRQLLPQDKLVTPGLKIASRFAPYSQVGGDYYDITELTNFFQNREIHSNDTISGPKVWGFMIADASGHGSAAAVEIAMFDAILRTYPLDFDAGPAGVFNYANRHLFTRTIRGSFITAFVSAYLPDANTLSYCNAGHPPPLLKRYKKPLEVLLLEESTGIPLGVTPDGQWQSASVEMLKGDTLILYTDGLTEAASQSGEAFGLQRLRSIIAQSDNKPDIILKNIEQALLAHQQQDHQNDDQTLLIIQAAV